MTNRAKTRVALLIMVLIPLFLAGCDGEGGGDVVYVEEGGYIYEPAVIENNSLDDILIDSELFGEIYLPPGSAVELDVGPGIDSILVFVNGSFFEEISVASGDIVIFD